MSVRRCLFRVLGGLQCVIGSVVSVLAFMIYVSPLVREELSIGEGEVSLFMLVLLVFGTFFIASGMVLVNGKHGVR